MLDRWKLWLSMGYALASYCTTCFFVIVANDRLPDRDKHPPLPDLVLDNMPYIPWGSTAAECILLVLLIMVLGLAVIHKNRVIYARRVFTLMGTLYLMRCVSIVVTAVPAPDPNKQCDVYPDSTLWHKWQRTLYMYSRMGVAMIGNRTCGDYIFSGHTVMLTLFNLSLNEYTPKSWKIFHAFCWIMNFLGMFFILANRGHYTIDVVIAFYITTQLFGNYHSLTDSRFISWREKRCSMICFPLLSFFESDTEGPVANEFSWPGLPTFSSGLNV